jgi:hypothetical protein
MSEKKVRITIEMSNSFVNLLNAGILLEGLHDIKNNTKKISPMQVLALLSCMEAMGFLPDSIKDTIPADWIGDISIISEERKVYEDGKLMGGGS